MCIRDRHQREDPRRRHLPPHPGRRDRRHGPEHLLELRLQGRAHPGPVSYTHLKVDLVKERIAGHGNLQRAHDLTRGHDRDERGAHAAATHDIDHGQASVSYTHLDVYKRQARVLCTADGRLLVICAN